MRALENQNAYQKRSKPMNLKVPSSAIGPSDHGVCGRQMKQNICQNLEGPKDEIVNFFGELSHRDKLDQGEMQMSNFERLIVRQGSQPIRDAQLKFSV